METARLLKLSSLAKMTFLEIQKNIREESYQDEGYEKISQFLQDCAVAGSFCAHRLFNGAWELSGYPRLSQEEMSGLPINYFPQNFFNVDIATHADNQTFNLWSDQERCQVMFKIYTNKHQLLFEHLKRIFLNGQSVIEVCEQYQHKIRSGKGGDIKAENFSDYYELVDPLIEENLSQEKVSGKELKNNWIASRITPEIVALIESGREGFGEIKNVKKRLEKRVRSIREKQ